MAFETADYNAALFAEWFYIISNGELVEFDRKLDRRRSARFRYGASTLASRHHLDCLGLSIMLKSERE
jgi:hypothetical protein